MTLEEIKTTLCTKEYRFLKDNEKLGKNIILLGLGVLMLMELILKHLTLI